MLLQMCSFSIILTSLHSLNLWFLLLFYVISTAILKFPPRFLASPPWFPTFFAFPPSFSAATFPCNSTHSHPYSPDFLQSVPQFPILAFTDSLLSLKSLKIYFRKIVALVQKPTLPFVTTAWPLAPNYWLHHLLTSSVL